MTDHDHALRQRIARERARNLLDDIEDAHLASGLQHAARRLNEFGGDIMFTAIIRRVLARTDGDVPPDLRERYLAARSEVAWMEDGLEISGQPADEGIRAVAELAVSLRDHHRHLASLVRSRRP